MRTTLIASISVSATPLLTVLTLMLSFLLFVIGSMQAAGVVTGQHFGYFFGLVLLPAAFLYSRNLLVAAPIAVAIVLVVAAALLDFERSPRTDLYLDLAAWLIAGLALSVVVARAVFGPGRITYHRVVGAVLLYLIIRLTFVVRLRRPGGAGGVHDSTIPTSTRRADNFVRRARGRQSDDIRRTVLPQATILCSLHDRSRPLRMHQSVSK